MKPGTTEPKPFPRERQPEYLSQDHRRIYNPSEQPASIVLNVSDCDISSSQLCRIALSESGHSITETPKFSLRRPVSRQTRLDNALWVSGMRRMPMIRLDSEQAAPISGATR